MSGAAGSIGSVYADALAAAAEGAGLMTQVGEEIAGFSSVWRRDKDVRDFFLSGAVSKAAKSKAIDAAARGRASDVFANFLHVLLHRGRLWLLPGAADAYRALLDKRLGRVPVQLSTAAPVSSQDLDAWRERLRASLGKEPILMHDVRPALIGGAVLRVGDTVADGSVRRRLADLRAQLSRAGLSAARTAAAAAP